MMMDILATLISTYQLDPSAFRLNHKDYSKPTLVKSAPLSQNSKTTNTKQNQRVSQHVDPLSPSPSLKNSLSESYEFLAEPLSGYTAIKNDVLSLLEAGYSDLDILTALGEKHNKLLIDRVLDDLRRKGLF